MFGFASRKMQMVSPEEALPGRAEPIPTAERHFVNGRPLRAEVPEGFRLAMFGMGCFWGAERVFWQQLQISGKCLITERSTAFRHRPV